MGVVQMDVVQMNVVQMNVVQFVPELVRSFMHIAQSGLFPLQGEGLM